MFDAVERLVELNEMLKSLPGSPDIEDVSRLDLKDALASAVEQVDKVMGTVNPNEGPFTCECCGKHFLPLGAAKGWSDLLDKYYLIYEHQRDDLRKLYPPYAHELEAARSGQRICYRCFKYYLPQGVMDRKANFVDGVRYRTIRGYRTIKTFSALTYDNAPDLPDDDSYVDSTAGWRYAATLDELKDRLKHNAAEAGGNAFVDFWYERHHGTYSVYGGESENGNSYYKTAHVTWYTGRATPVLVEKLPTRAELQGKKMSCIIDLPKDRPVIIDGSNLVLHDSKILTGTLRTLLNWMDQNQIPIRVYFDANIQFVLNKRNRQGDWLRIWSWTERFPDNVKIVPSGMKADDCILQDANDNDAHVISNDTFADYVERYPWVDKNSGRIHHYLVFGNRLMIPDINLNIAIE